MLIDQHCVKTGIVGVEFSDFYGAVMEDRHIGDYTLLTSLDYETTRRDLVRAQRFLAYIEQVLHELGVQ